MAEPNPRRSGTAPAALRAVRVILYVQGGATLLALVGIVLEIKSRLDHGQDVNGIAYVFGVISVGCAVLALLCATAIVARGRNWARPVALGLEVVTIVYGLINIFTGVLTGLGEIAVGVVVIVLLTRVSVQDWVDGRA